MHIYACIFVHGNISTHICGTKTRHINSLFMKIIFGSHTPIPNPNSCKQNPGVTLWWVLCEIGCSWPVPRTHSQDLQESSDCHRENYLYQSVSGKHNPLGIMDGGTSYKKPTATLHCRQKEGKCRAAVGIAQWLIWETKMASHREKGLEGDEKLSCSYCLHSLPPASGKGLGQLWICSWDKEQTWNREEPSNWN